MAISKKRTDSVYRAMRHRERCKRYRIMNHALVLMRGRAYRETKAYRDRMKDPEYRKKRNEQHRLRYSRTKEEANFKRRERWKDPIHREKLRECARLWYLRNSEKVKQDAARYRKKHHLLVLQQRREKLKNPQYHALIYERAKERRLRTAVERNALNRWRYHNDPVYRKKAQAHALEYRQKNREVLLLKGRMYLDRPGVRERANQARVNRRRSDPEYKKFVYSYHKTPQFLQRLSIKNRMRYRSDSVYRDKLRARATRYHSQCTRAKQLFRTLGLLQSLNSKEGKDVISTIGRTGNRHSVVHS